MAGRTPNYMLIETHICGFGYGQDAKTIPAGSFVRPIGYQYLPSHILEDSKWKHIDRETNIFCYTKFGIFPIPKNLLRET